MIAVEARRIVKRFGNTPVLTHLDLSIPAGSIFGLLGRNGAGKTTLFRLLLGLARLDEGQLAIFGQSAVHTAACRARIGYVADGDILPEWATIGEVVRFEARTRTRWDEAALTRWREAEGLDRGRRIANLSKGQRKRFEVELALAGKPELLLLDEPFANLDPVAKSEALQMLLDHAASTGATLVLSSHVLSDLERICDRVGVLTGGNIPIDLPMDELKESSAFVTRIAPAAGADLPNDLRVLATWPDGQTQTSIVTGLNDHLRSALATGGYRIRNGSLEEIGTELLRALGRD